MFKLVKPLQEKVVYLFGDTVGRSIYHRQIDIDVNGLVD